MNTQLFIFSFRGQPTSKTFTCRLILRSFEVLPPGGFFSQPKMSWGLDQCCCRLGRKRCIDRLFNLSFLNKNYLYTPRVISYLVKKTKITYKRVCYCDSNTLQEL